MSDRISWLSVPDEEHVPEEIKSEIWEPVREKVGFVPNVARIFAARPSHLLRWWRYYDDLLRGDSGLTRGEREMIAVVVSTVNECHYCTTSHGAALRLLTKDPALADQIAADYRTAPLEPRQRAMLDWAVKVTTASGKCTEADVESLREAGWSDEDIMDMTETAAMFNFTNRLANSLGWMPNPEYDELGR